MLCHTPIEGVCLMLLWFHPGPSEILGGLFQGQVLEEKALRICVPRGISESQVCANPVSEC
jgi:hypothetical protein